MAEYEIKTGKTATVKSDSSETLVELELEHDVTEDGDTRIILTVNENMLSIDEAKVLHVALGELLEESA